MSLRKRNAASAGLASEKSTNKRLKRSRQESRKSDKLIIDAKLGEGAAGEVFSGRWKGTAVAIKKPKSLLTNDSILAEAHKATSMEHPNIVKSYGIVNQKGSNFLVMELMHCSLHDLMQNSGAVLPRRNVIRIALDIAESLKYLHSLTPKIIHRDLKPANILLTAEFSAKLSDFGSARYLSNDSLANTVTGTLSFMAPEVLAEESYDEKADIYSFGAILYAMVCGLALPPLEERKRIQRIEGNVPIDTGLQQLTVSCCQNDPTTRPNVEECIEILKEILQLM